MPRQSDSKRMARVYGLMVLLAGLLVMSCRPEDPPASPEPTAHTAPPREEERALPSSIPVRESVVQPPAAAIENFARLRNDFRNGNTASTINLIRRARERYVNGDFLREEVRANRNHAQADASDLIATNITREAIDKARAALALEQSVLDNARLQGALRDVFPTSVRNISSHADELENLAAGAMTRSGGGSSAAHGALLFLNPDFGTNDRACNTCHMLAQNFSIGPQAVQVRWALRNLTNDPLFRNIDADVVGGNTYSLLRNTATFNVDFTLPPNISVASCGTPAQPNTRLQPDGRCKVWVRRASPTVRNTALLEPTLMLDGREPNLEGQAPNAVTTHNQPSATSRQFTPTEASHIAAFQRTLFSSQALRNYAQNPTATPTLPPGNTPAEQRGRVMFVEGPMGRCADCHTGPMLNMTSMFNFAPSINAVTGQVVPWLSNNATTEQNPSGLPSFVFNIQEPIDGPGAPPRVVTTHDLGRAMTTGSLCLDSVLVCLFNPGSGISLMRTPTLWGVGNNPRRYFHDNSAATITEVFAHYTTFFHATRDRLLATPGFEGAAPLFDVTPEQMADAQAYFEAHIANTSPPN